MPELGNCSNPKLQRCKAHEDCFLERYRNYSHLKSALENLNNFEFDDCRKQLEHLLRDAERYCLEHDIATNANQETKEVKP